MKLDADIFNIIQEYKQKYMSVDCAIPGVNGPYNMKETPMRTTAHWIITFSIMFYGTNDTSYLPIIKRFSDYILKNVNESSNGAIICMLSDDNQTNGLIGLSWVIDALIRASEVLDSNTYLLAAEKIYNSQMYCPKKHIWLLVDSENNCKGIDMAFNHNLWFAVSGYQLSQKTQNKKIESEVNDFIDHITKHFLVYKNGLLSHFTFRSGEIISDCKTLLRFIFCQLSGRGTPWNDRNIVEYERAYHLFSMYAFARLYTLNPECEFWNSKKFYKLKSFTFNINHFINFQDEVAYAYLYNSPAYEYPFIYKIFGEEKGTNPIIELLRKHKAVVADTKKKSTFDIVTLDARIYELMQFYELEYNWKKGKESSISVESI